MSTHKIQDEVPKPFCCDGFKIARKAVLVVFRIYCKENDYFMYMYESREWLPIKLITNCDMPAITDSSNWPDQVISDVHVATITYVHKILVILL